MITTDLTATPITSTASISFRVDDVEQKHDKLRVKSLREQIVAGMGKKPAKESESQGDSLVSFFGNRPAQEPYRILGLYRDAEVLDQLYKRNHPLLHAVHKSFANHLPLTLSPDMFWQTILQGVAQHIAQYPEEHRHLFVKHEGKITLSIFRPDLSLGDLSAIGTATPSIVSEFVEMVGAEVSPAYFKALRRDFSTTTPVERVAAAISCMDAFSPYFDYCMYCGCGFPKITLRGTVEDWRALKAKVIEIEELFALSNNLNLTWWTTKLRQIVDHLIAAAQGEPDIAWWKRMYKQVDVYLDYQFNGWIGWLWPYTKTHDQWTGGSWVKAEREWKRNPMLESDLPATVTVKSPEYISTSSGNKIPDKTFSLASDIPSISFSSYVDTPGFMTTSDFPMGLSKVSLKIIDLTGEALDTTLIGGFVGVSQDDEGGLLPRSDTRC